LDVLSAIKKSIVVVKAAFLYLAGAIIIAMARVNNDPMHKSYRDGCGLHKPVEEFFNASGVDLSNDVGFEELQQFQQYLMITKLLCLMDCTQIGSCLAKIPFRPRNYIYYIIGTLGTIM
jgi:hypothetical protein